MKRSANCVAFIWPEGVSPDDERLIGMLSATCDDSQDRRAEPQRGLAIAEQQAAWRAWAMRQREGDAARRSVTRWRRSVGIAALIAVAVLAGWKAGVFAVLCWTVAVVPVGQEDTERAR